MSAKTIFLVLVVSVFFLNGCAGLVTRSNSNSKPAKGSGNSAGATAGSTEKIGIAECDEYIAKYEACTPKVPEAGRAAYKAGLDSTRASWKKLADNPQTRGALASACKQALQTAAATWKGYGCE